MFQDLLFQPVNEDLPEHELEWIYTPNALATDEDLRKFFNDLSALNDNDGEGESE